MIVVIKNQSGESRYELPFSIGDIVKVVTYGRRYCVQEETNKLASFYKGKPLRLPKIEDYGSYHTLDEEYHDLQWIVSDVGVFNTPFNTLTNVQYKFYKFLIIKLTARDKGELLMQYEAEAPNECFKVIRKAKKQIGEYIINLSNK